MMLAALVAAAALSAAPASAATPPRDFVGVTAREPMSSTELGRLAGSKARVYRVLPEATQARYLSDLYRQAVAARGALKVAGLIWFSYRDTSPAPGGSFYWGFRTGLHRESGMPKPAWTAFSRFARSAR